MPHSFNSNDAMIEPRTGPPLVLTNRMIRQILADPSFAVRVPAMSGMCGRAAGAAAKAAGGCPSCGVSAAWRALCAEFRSRLAESGRLTADVAGYVVDRLGYRPSAITTYYTADRAQRVHVLL